MKGSEKFLPEKVFQFGGLFLEFTIIQTVDILQEIGYLALLVDNGD